MQAPLRANFATLEQIYAVGITKAGYDRARRPPCPPWRAAAPGRSRRCSTGPVATTSTVPCDAQNQAGRRLGRTVILLLLLAFVVYFRRAAQARAVAAGLAPRERTAAGRQPP